MYIHTPGRGVINLDRVRYIRKGLTDNGVFSIDFDTELQWFFLYESERDHAYDQILERIPGYAFATIEPLVIKKDKKKRTKVK
jgi:hypothetical protein